MDSNDRYPGSMSAYCGPVCRGNCKCACHAALRATMPSFLSRTLGHFFIENAGIPVLSTKCDMSTCANAHTSHLYAEYWSPPALSWSRIITFCAFYHANLGPLLQLRVLRRVPDSAPAVNFAMSGNIEGLQGLFRSGEASPQDVSDTRGYSLIRVSTAFLTK